MNDSIVKLALGITLIYTTLFPIRKPLSQEAEYDVSYEVESKYSKVPDHIKQLYKEENTIIWHEFDMKDNAFTEGPSCKIDIH